MLSTRAQRALKAVGSIAASLEDAPMNVSCDYRHLSRQILCQAIPMAAVLVLCAMAGAWLITLPFNASPSRMAWNPHAPPSLGLGPSSDTAPVSVARRLPTLLNFEPPAAPSVATPEPKNAPAAPSQTIASPTTFAPVPPPRPTDFGFSTPPSGSVSRLGGTYANEAFKQSVRYDRWTAIYDLEAHTVYLPGGGKLEAHSGLGDRLDDPQHVSEINRGATPPHLYELTLREAPFHGVQALRLTPVGGGVFGRVGLLAHSYMLGPNGDSNGCVSFKDYASFLQAYQNGQVKRLAVVASLK
jgi:hypothetical protein